MPVCALAVRAQSMGVLPCNQQMLFVYSVHFGTLCVRSLVHQYITEVRDLWGRKERVTLRIRKNKAIRKVIKIEQLLMQPLFYSFCCHVLEKRGV